ncbi:MAG: hypothetical protein AAF205_02920 [Pseudomonadota bacterium]
MAQTERPAQAHDKAAVRYDAGEKRAYLTASEALCDDLVPLLNSLEMKPEFLSAERLFGSD